MNSKERFFARMQNKPVDKIPNLNIIMTFGSNYIKKPHSNFLNDYRVLTEANIKCAQDFGIDIVSTISCPYREAEGFGLKIKYPIDDLPIATGHLINEYSDINKLSVVNPRSAYRMNDRLEAIQYYKRQVGNEYPIMGWIEGPIAEACDLRNLSEVMYDFLDEPSFVEDLMDICMENGINFAREQIKEGADVIGMGDAAASLIGPALYEEFVLPREKKIIEEVHKMGALVKLHICGNINKIMPFIAQTNADIVDIDWMVDINDTVKTLEYNQCANGNFDPAGVLLHGTPDLIKKAVLNCIQQGEGRLKYVSAGCEVPKNTPHENLKAVHEALVEYGAAQ